MKKNFFLAIVVLGMVVAGQLSTSCHSGSTTKGQSQVDTLSLSDRVSEVSIAFMRECRGVGCGYDSYDSLTTLVIKEITTQPLQKGCQELESNLEFMAVYNAGWDGLCGDVYDSYPNEIMYLLGYLNGCKYHRDSSRCIDLEPYKPYYDKGFNEALEYKKSLLLKRN